MSSEMPWVIFYLLDKQFAVSTNVVREMVAMPKVVSVSHTPEYIRGVMNLRGKVIPVMDLRQRMEMRSLSNETEELITTLAQRAKEHQAWIAELEASVRENREFKLTTNPHQCAFGRWYDNFRTNNRILQSSLRKFDSPHQAIHGVAIKVKEFVEKGDIDGAQRVISRTRKKELALMMGLFSEVSGLLRDDSREIALVLEWKEKTLVISVDSVAAVETLKLEEIEEMPDVASTTGNGCITGIGKRGKDNDLVQLLSVENLIDLNKDFSAAETFA